MESYDQSVEHVKTSVNAPADPDQHWAKELAERGQEAEKQVAYHHSELERWQRIGRAVQAAHSELTNQPEQSSEPRSW